MRLVLIHVELQSKLQGQMKSDSFRPIYGASYWLNKLGLLTPVSKFRSEILEEES